MTTWASPGRCLLERPLLIPLASLIAGLFAADLLDSVPPPWALPSLLLTTLAACFVTARLPFLLSLSLLFFVWGGISLQPFLRPVNLELTRFAGRQPVVVEGVVYRRPEGSASGGGRVYLQVERVGIAEADTAVAGRLLVYVKQGRAQLCTGDRVLFSARIRVPRSYGLPGEIDHPRRLAYQGVFATAFLMEADDFLLILEGAGWRHGIDRLAAALGRFIVRRQPGPEGGVLKALLLGDRGDVPEELSDAFARSGVNHILSISGFHIGIIFFCLFQFLYFTARRFEAAALHLNLKQVLLTAALPVVVFYLFLSGAAPATLRSVLMISGFVVALHLKREMEPVNSTMLAACAILFAAPEALFEVSFQLSFLAIWGLVVLAPPLAAPFANKGKAARWLLLLAVASTAAVLATLVPVAYYFQRVSLVGLFANLIIVPLMGYGAVVSGFASLALSFAADKPAEALLQLAAFLVGLSDQVVLYLARTPVLTGYAPAKLDLLLSCLVLCAVTFPRSRAYRLFAVIPLLLALAVRAAPAGGTGDGLLRLYFLSVGQGDAALVHLPDGKWMLVDGGGNATDVGMRVGSRLLLPALRRLDVPRIDYLVLSHEHPDHLQGVLYLAAGYEVGEFWESGVPSASPEYQKLKWVLAARGIPVRLLNASHAPVSAGGALFEPLWPIGPESSASGDANGSSLVFRMVHGESSVLFTGDLGAKEELELLTRGAPLGCSLLKVAHHGSKHSSCDPFLAAAKPKAAVVSAGYGNSFHLPAASTISRLQKRGIRVYRTDLDGTVQAVLDSSGTLAVSTPWGAF